MALYFIGLVTLAHPWMGVNLFIYIVFFLTDKNKKKGRASPEHDSVMEALIETSLPCAIDNSNNNWLSLVKFNSW